jgi:hypothetical protein
MYQSINFSAFCDAFRSMDRQDQFTYDAKRALFDYLEDMEDQTGTRIELDVIALCCDYIESTFDEVRQSYSLDDMSDEDVAEYICENTAYVGLIGADSILYANF